jgi:hypothetical protein
MIGAAEELRLSAGYRQAQPRTIVGITSLTTPQPTPFTGEVADSSTVSSAVAMPSADGDPRIASVKPRITYNTIGGVNGPLVILDNVSVFLQKERSYSSSPKPFYRSNSQDTMRSCPLLCPMAQRDQDRCWKLEVSWDKLLQARAYLITRHTGNRAIVQVS